MGKTLLLGMLITLIPVLQKSDPWFINPDGQSGAITRMTSKDDLIRAYGNDNVTDGEVEIGEGETEPGTILYPNDPMKILHVIWTDPKTKMAPKRIQLTGETSRWKTLFGITLGTTLKELEKINRRPFRLLGFGWDYSGTAISWSGGELSQCCEPRGATFMRLLPRDLDGELYARLGRQVLGDREFSSGHPAMQELNPRIYQIVFEFR